MASVSHRGGHRHRRAQPGLALVALALTAAGCASTLPAANRGDVIRRILASTVQLRSEREGGLHRAASGVVVATDPASGRAWIVTVRHFVMPFRPQEVFVQLPGDEVALRAVIHAVSAEDYDLDLAIIEMEHPGVAAARLKETVGLGDEVLIAAFPWGQYLTVVRGIVSRIASGQHEALVAGPARMIDAPVSYGSSGGGVFDAQSGELVGIVETYRTAKIALPESPGRTIEVPVPGETTLVPAQVISRFLREFGLDRRLGK
jgi:S1-C subfamily serine protease